MRVRVAVAVVAIASLACGLSGGPASPPPPCGDASGPDCAAAGEDLRAADPVGATLRLEDACLRLDAAAACEPAAQLLRAGAITATLDDPTGVHSPFGRAMHALEHGCGLGVGTACEELGMLAFKGTGVPRDLDEAMRRFHQACDAGVADGCVDAGLVAERQGASPDAVLGAVRTGCERGSGHGCAKLGLLLLDGTRLPVDAAGGVDAFERACTLGFSAGCGLAALQLEGGREVAADPARRRRMLEAGARLMDPVAADLLTTLPDVDAATLEAIGQEAGTRCDQGGDAKACHVAGILRAARGAPPAEIAAVLTTACASKEGGACGRLAGLVHAGAVPDTFGKLVDLDNLGCTGGYAPACLELGRALQAGVQTEGVDLDGARTAYIKACRGGVEDGCAAARALGVRTEPGGPVGATP